MSSLDLSIIIVNWNSKEYLRKCITSILRSRPRMEFEIVVIDSGSFDGSDEMLKRYYPDVNFVQSEKNLGFAKANNEAYKASLGRNLLFLNPDTEIEKHSIEKLLYQLESLPDAAIVGAKLLNSDRTIQTSCIQAFPSILNQILDAEVLRKRFPRWKLWGMEPLFDKSNVSVEVDAVSGACLMIKRSIFENIGMFSTRYFMYSEDIDLCFKTWEAGLKVYFVPMASVIHHGGASASQNKENSFSDVMMLESQWRFFRETRSLWYCHLYCLAMFSISLLRLLLLSFLWPIFSINRKTSLVGIAFKKWIARLRWTLGMESWVKNY